MSTIQISVEAPPRGGGSQTPQQFAAQSMRGSFAWGGAPATATLVYIGDAPVTVGALVNIQAGAHWFAGICRSDTQMEGSRGQTRELVFSDLREFLTWDYVYCAFNMPVRRLVNGVWKKRYWHIYPADFDLYIKTWTDFPVPAYQIVSALFTAPTVGSPWQWNLTGNGLFPSGLMNQPVFSFNCLNGVRLDAALNEISERGGLVYTLDSIPGSDYRLVWTRKGYGQVPFNNPALIGPGSSATFPQDSDDRRSGLALSGHATNIRVLGDRNRYLVLNLPLVANWNSEWQQFLVNDALFLDIYQNEKDPVSGLPYTNFTDDPENWKGAYAAKIRALQITVGEYVNMRNSRSGDGNQFADRRKFSGRSRMDMPAALYIQMLVFRAYAPDVFGITNINGATVPLESAAIVDAMPCRVTYDPVSGAMFSNRFELTDGNGVGIVKGTAFGQDLFRLVDPERITPAFFAATSRPWTQIPFQVDDSGEGQRFIVFESPVFAADDMLVEVDGLRVLNANPTIVPVAAKAALTFELEPFSYWKGTYPNVSRDRVEYVSGLCEEFVGVAGNYARILFASGMTAADQADQIASNLLLAQYIYASGGYKLNWRPTIPYAQFGTFLTSVIDRVEIEFSPGGFFEIVDFTTERDRAHFVPERDLERRTLQNTLFPGQAELKQAAMEHKRFAAGIKSTPRDLFDRFIEFLKGNFEEAMIQVRIDLASSNNPTPIPQNAVIRAGTPIFKKPTVAPASPSTANTNTLATYPGNVDAKKDTVLIGVTVREGELAVKPFYAKRLGETIARVQGPVSANDPIGMSAKGGQDYTTNGAYFVKGGVMTFGVALQAIAGTDIRLIKVNITSSGDATDPVWL